MFIIVCVFLLDVLPYLNPSLSCDLCQIGMCPVPFIRVFFSQSVRFCAPLLLTVVYSLTRLDYRLLFPGFCFCTVVVLETGNKIFCDPYYSLDRPGFYWFAQITTLCPDSVSQTGYPVISLSAGDRPLPVCFAIILI